jgi:hypothetical protein
VLFASPPCQSPPLKMRIMSGPHVGPFCNFRCGLRNTVGISPTKGTRIRTEGLGGTSSISYPVFCRFYQYRRGFGSRWCVCVCGTRLYWKLYPRTSPGGKKCPLAKSI